MSVAPMQSDSPIPIAATIAPLRMSPRDAINRMAGTAIRGIHIDAHAPGTRPQDLDASGRRDLLATLRRHELYLSGIDCWIAAESLRDRAECDRRVEQLVAAVRLASDLNRVPVHCLIPVQQAQVERDTTTGHRDSSLLISADTAVNMEGITETIASVADRLGVPVANYALSNDQALDGASQQAATSPVPGTCIGIGIDPAALLAHGFDPAQQVLLANAHLAAARLVDVGPDGLRGPAIGQGRLNLTEYAAALSVVGFDQPIIIDARQWQYPWHGMLATADAWRQVIQADSA